MFATITQTDHFKRVDLLARYLYSRDADSYPRGEWQNESDVYKQGYRDDAVNVLRAVDNAPWNSTTP